MVDINWNTAPAYLRRAHFDTDRMAGTVPVWGNASSTKKHDDVTVSSTALASSAPSRAQSPQLNFSEFLDIVNPLQHIPVIDTIYRNLTGDGQSSVARIIGGGLYGGAIGGVVSLITSAIEEHSGQPIEKALLTAAQETASDETQEALSQLPPQYHFNS